MTIFLKLYGMPYAPKILKGTTAVGLLTLVNSARDIFVWLDEFKNDTPPHILEMMKSNYDGSDKVVGNPDVFTTKTRRHRTGMLVSGEFRATDTALNQRCVLVNLKKAENPSLLMTTRDEAEGLSAYIVSILRRQESFWNDMFETYKKTIITWQKELKVDIRIVENYAKVYAALQTALKDDTREARFIEYIQAKVNDSGDKNPMVEALQFLANLVNGNLGHTGWVPFYVKVEKDSITEFNVRLPG